MTGQANNKLLKYLEERDSLPVREKPLTRQELDQNGAFWNYCTTTAARVRYRSSQQGLPFGIDAHFINKLFVDQKWHCIISGIKFQLPSKRPSKRAAFSPSLDRITPNLGYVPGNVRLVCNIVNAAMNDWGEESLQILFHALARKLVYQLTTDIDELAKIYPDLEKFARRSKVGAPHG